MNDSNIHYQYKFHMMKHYTFVLLLILIMSLSQVLAFKLRYPIGFGLVRFVSPSATYEEFLNQIGQPTLSADQTSQLGYNLISLDGFKYNSKFNTLDSELTPVSIWKRMYQIVMGNKPNRISSDDSKIREHVVDKVFHAKGSKLLMNVDLTNSPITRLNANPEQIAREAVSVANQLYLDGVSMQFSDYHAVKENTASDWLQKLLRGIRTNSQNEDFLVVLIIPSTFPTNIRLFKSHLINSLVDLFVLRYYDTNKPDYISYNAMFSQATYYPGTALFQIMKNTEVVMDICRTLIAKPITQIKLRNPTQYANSTNLQSQFTQAFNEMGWFGGYANLEHGADRENFVDKVLGTIRQQCDRFENCIC